MTAKDVRSYLNEHSLSVVVVGEHKGKYFTLLIGELNMNTTGKRIGYAEAIARCSHLDHPDSNIGYKVALSRLEKALVKKHLGHGRALHHPLYA